MPILPLKQLIKGAIVRARISRQVDARHVLMFINDSMHRLVPGSHRQLKATSYKDGVVSIHALSSVVRHALAGVEQDVLRKVREAFPEKPVDRFVIRLSKRFPTEEL